MVDILKRALKARHGYMTIGRKEAAILLGKGAKVQNFGKGEVSGFFRAFLRLQDVDCIFYLIDEWPVQTIAPAF